jgi:hypothetical protein
MNVKYYIGTGAQECFYTLRYRFYETVYARTETGVQNIGAVERDYHVRNLSTDRETAIAKAREITGLGLNADFEVCEIVKRDEVDWSVFQAGKYSGQSIHEVAASDREYLCWACENLKTSKSYAKTIELAAALVAHDLATRAGDRASAAAAVDAEREALKTAAAPIAAILKGCSRQPGDFCASLAENLEKGIRPRGRAHSLVLDIYAKAHGRRNSKGYTAAYNAAWEILGKEEGSR